MSKLFFHRGEGNACQRQRLGGGFKPRKGSLCFKIIGRAELGGVDSKKVFSGKSPKARDFWTLGNKVEILAKTADGKRLQLAVDSNGKIFDRMDTDAAWEGFFDIPVRKTDSGWSTMITLPYAFCGYRTKPEIFRFLCIRYYVKNTDGSNSDRAAMQLFSDNAYESRYPFGYPVLE